MKLETHERSRASPRWSYEPHTVIYRMALSTCRAICCSTFFFSNLNPIQSNPFIYLVFYRYLSHQRPHVHQHMTQ